MVGTRSGRSSPRSLERLAKGLVAEAQISFDEHRAFLFAQKAKATISETRTAYRALVRNLSERAESTQGVEVLLDNFYIIEGALSELSLSWKQKITLRVPQSSDSEGDKQPRVYIVARALVKDTDAHIDRETIVEFLKAYQKSAPLSVRELDIFPNMLRFALVEEIIRLVGINLSALREIKEADTWYVRIVKAASRKDASTQLKKLTALLADEYAIIPQTFGLHLLHRLMQKGKESDVRLVSRWLKLSLAKQGASYFQLSTMNARTARVQTATISNLIASLRYLAQMRWSKVSKDLNMIDAILEKDPTVAFNQLSTETRSAYRQTIVRIADRTGTHDIEVAHEALRLARQYSEYPEDKSRRAQHVGYYLVDKGVAELESALGYTPTLIERTRTFIIGNSTGVYLGFMGGMTLTITVLLLLISRATELLLLPFLVMLFVGLILTSEITTALAHFLFTRVVKPKPLPALDLMDGVGESRRTVVVMPSMFRNEESAKKILRRMETNFVANRDPHIFYALLMDFRDAPALHMPDDAERVDEIASGIKALNERYPSPVPRFVLFHRERKWNPNEKAFMGWERKRGKLRELNNLLRRKTTSYAGDAKNLVECYGVVRYVIALDEDTELVRDSAQALVGTIDHPLNRPIVDREKGVVTEGYGIIQPQTALRFREVGVSVFSHLFGSFPGVDAYSSFVSDLHQDLFGEAIFHGKGIYDIDAVEETMAEHIPENTVLSHDLLEGCYARVGVASGARIFEGFPSNYREHIQRLHRWVRGDWQVTPWIFQARGGIFSAIARYRIFDNIRRSFLPVAATLAVLFSAFSPADMSIWSVTALLALGSGQLVSSILSVTERTIDWRNSMSGFARFESLVVGFGIAVAKTILLGIFVLHNAIVTVDAILRSMWRLFVSKKKLLEWQTAHDAANARKNSIKDFLRFMWRSLCASLFLVYIEFSNGQIVDVLAMAWIFSWASAPLFATLISIERSTHVLLPASDRLYLRTIAARTYWFFLDLATRETSWLVPDHFQEDPPSKRHSHGPGTSPTNLGMYLLSLSIARVLGFSSISEYALRIERAFGSIKKMERYRGHFFNWYELKELTPLAPRYVSSVDSANLALSLLAVRGALLDSCGAPIVARNTFEGIEAELAVLLESCERTSVFTIERSERRQIDEVKSALRESLALVQKAFGEEITPRGSDLVSSGVIHHMVRTRNALETLRIEGKSERFDEIFLAARHTESIAKACRENVSLYLGHTMVPVVSSIANNPKLHALYLKLSLVLQRIPSIDELSDGVIRRSIESIGIDEAIKLSELAAPEKERAGAWYTEVVERLAESEKNAMATQSALKGGAAITGNYIREMNFAFLYNEERGLFHIGYNDTTKKLDEAFYDLLASEANSASIVGIAKRDIPRKHWDYLGRKLIKSGKGDTLVASWAGSLFEYLGTQIYFDVPRESFWGVSAQRAIAAHQFFAKRYRIPWGMGEAASSRRDAAENYHYQAFGEPSLGFKRDLSESIVVAPYTSALALAHAPRETVKNFIHLSDMGALGRYGFYDAIDFTARRRKSDRELPGIPARIYYAHHQGFVLSSIVNVLARQWVQRMVASDPEMEVTTQLFEEKMPEGVTGERTTVVVPEMRGVRREFAPIETHRQYLPWRTKEATSCFLSSGKYHTRITTTGAGESGFGSINVTRESTDALRESTGTFFYLYNASQEKLWSPTFMPTKDAGDKHAVSTGEQVIVFEKTSGDIKSSLLVTALPHEEGELRELTLTNTGETESVLSFGVCAELALVRSSEESSRPNYERLFIATETHLGNQAIIASRPDSHDRNRTIVAGFLLVSDGTIEGLRAIRAKEVFFGSPQSKEIPPVLRDPSLADVVYPVHTLDSVAAFVGELRLKPKETRRISLVMFAGTGKEEVLSTFKRLRSHKELRKIASGADSEGGKFLTEAGITQSESNAYSAIASHTLSRTMKRGDDTDPSVPPWVLAFWKMSISGTRPTILLSVNGITDLPMIRQFLICRSYFVKKGIAIDMIIFNDHSGGYLKTFEDEIDFLLNTHRLNDGHALGAIVHVRTEQMNAGERAAILAAATVRIDAKKGSLVDAAELLHRTHLQKYPQKLEPTVATSKEIYEVLGRGVEDRLKFWNGIGGYDERTREYVICSRKESRPPRPWSHIVANQHIGFLATDRGMSFTWSRNSYDNKLTVPYNDALSEFTGEAIYVRDDASGAIMSPLPLLGNASAEYEVRFGEGYCTYVSRGLDITMELSLYVGNTTSVKYYRLELTNHGKKKKSLSLFGYIELLLGNSPQETKKLFSLDVKEGNIVIAKQKYRHQFTKSRAFVGIVGDADEFTASREEFLGRHGEICAPAALKRERLSSKVAEGDEPAVALQKRVVLSSGETQVVTFFLGEADEEQLDRVLASAAHSNDADAALIKAKQYWATLPIPTCELPDPTLSALVNHFLPYQLTVSRLHARLGFYQIGGAYGYRDQLQDALAVLWYDPSWVRKHILAAALHQFREGDVLSWWQPHNDFGARTRLSDPQLWLPYVTLRYVQFTGDNTILDEVIPYLSGDIPDKADHQSVIGVFSPSKEKSSVYEHLIRAVEHSLTSGAHGLPLMGAADWNDGMNRVGVDGEGESVWLAWFTIQILDEISVLVDLRGDADRATRYRSHASRYRDALKNGGWDGRWYRRAFTDNGVLVGTGAAKAFRLDSITQSWAYFADGATKESKEALQSAKDELSIYEGHVPLAWPPSSRSILDLGTISDYPPGVRENASQYNHAALWLAQALFASGDSDGGKIIVDAVNPFKRTATKEKVAVYQGEPYVVAAEVYSTPTYPGRAGWTWYTASAGVLYRTILEYMLGIRRTGNTLSFTPSFPSGWESAKVTLPFGKSSYRIAFSVRSDLVGKIAVTLDGVEATGGVVLLRDDGKVHEVVVAFGRTTTPLS